MGITKKTRHIIIILIAFFIAISACSILLFFTSLHNHTPTKKPNISIHNTETSSPTAAVSQNKDNNYSNHTHNQTTKPTSSSEPKYQIIASTRTNQSVPTFKTKTGEAFPLRTYKLLSVNDPSGTQWWTTSTGLDSVWDIGAGARQTVVAVIDTGFSLKHEEFSNRWAINSGEQGSIALELSSKYNCSDRSLPLDKSCNLIDDNFDGIVDNEIGTTTIENPSQLNCTDQGIALNKSCNLIDDDNNGYIDDVTGWDFANNDASVQAGETNPNGTGTAHGTEVAGVMAATGNNGIGIAGVNWTTKILPLQAISDDAYGNTLTVTRAIYYAVNRGVDIINLSLGSDAEDTYLRQAIQYAIGKGVIVVAASGNDGCNCMSYPAQYPEVLAVGAQGIDGNRASFSSYGNNLDVMAPGENITTTTWTKANPTNAYINGANGTSFATPYISGLLSLARSHQTDASWGELINNLLSTANHANLTTNNPTSPQIGSGYAQANNFINRITTPVKPGMRYDFGLALSTSTLSSSLVYQCTDDDFPTAPLYKITTKTATSYTIDTLDYIRALANDNQINNLGRFCVGLPGDQPNTTRVINLLSELSNIPANKTR